MTYDLIIIENLESKVDNRKYQMLCLFSEKLIVRSEKEEFNQ